MAKLVDPLQSPRPLTPVRPIARAPGGVVQLADTGPNPNTALGLVGAGRALQVGSDEIYTADRIETNRIDKAVAEENYTEFQRQVLQMSHGEGGYTHLKGKDAVSRQIYPQWTKRFDEAADKILNTLTNDDQRAMFRERVLVARNQYQAGLMQHMAVQGDVHAKQVYDGIVDVAQENAKFFWNSPNEIGASIVRIADAIADRAERFGWTDDEIAAARIEEYSKVHSTVIRQAMLNEQYEYAEEYYKAHTTQIDEKTALALRKEVEYGTQRQLSADYTKEYLANDQDLDGLVELHKRVLTDKELDDVPRNTLVGRIQNQMYRLENQAQAVETRELNKLSRDLGSYQSAFMTNFPAGADVAADLHRRSRGTIYEEEADAMFVLEENTKEYRNKSLLEQESILFFLRDKATNEPGSVDTKVYAAFEQIYKHNKQMAKDNPFAYALGTGGTEAVAAMWDISKPMEDEGVAFRGQAEIMRNTRNKTGASQLKVFTPEQTRMLTDFLGTLPREAKAEYFGQLWQASGEDMEIYKAGMRQLSEHDALSARAGMLVANGRRYAAELLLGGIEILNPKDTNIGKQVMPSDTHMQEAFNSMTENMYKDQSIQKGADYAATRAVYAALDAKNPSSTPEILDESMLVEAYETAKGRLYRYNGEPLTLPHINGVPMEEDEFEEATRQHIRAKFERDNQARAEMKRIHDSMSVQESLIWYYHKRNADNNKFSYDSKGRKVTVLPTGIKARDGKHKGKFVLVPGFLPDGRLEQDEKSLWEEWKDEIENDDWPVYDTKDELEARSREINKLMETTPGMFPQEFTLDRLLDLELRDAGEGRYRYVSNGRKLQDIYGNDIILDHNQPLLKALPGSNVPKPTEDRTAP